MKTTKTNTKTTTAVKAVKPPSVFEQAHALVKRLEVMERTRATALALLLKSEQALGSARRRFGDASVVAISEAPNGHLPQVPERYTVEEATNDLMQAELTLVSCIRASRALDAEALSLREVLRCEYQEYRERVIRLFLQDNATLLEQYRCFQRKAVALADALGQQPRQQQYPCALAETLATPATDWRGDEAATKLHRDHAEQFRILTQLERLSGEHEFRALHPQNYPAENLPVPRQRYMVRQAVQLSGIAFMPGTVISAFTVPGGCWGILGKLVDSEKIVPTEIE